MVSPKRWLRDLTGRGHREIVTALLGQIAVAREAGGVLAECVGQRGGPTGHAVDGLVDRLEELERRGDEQRGRLVEELTRTLSAPIDREDFFRVSRSVDDVLDDLRDFAREVTLYAPQRRDRCAPLFDALDEGLAFLQDAVAELGEDEGRVLELAHRAKRCCSSMRRAFEDALADLFAQELSVEVLKERELLRRLDIVALRLGEAADALADGQMKRR